MIPTHPVYHPLPCWERRIAHYLRTALMPHQWTCHDRADRRCARCGVVLKQWGTSRPRDVPACTRCELSVAEAIVTAWEGA